MPLGLLGGYPAHWITSGDGPARILLLHCALGHAGAWGGVMTALAPHAAMVSMDLPGHGRSGALELESWQDQAVAMARAALDLLGEGPVHVAGHSFGGTVALRLAVEAPERVSGLTLVEPVQFSLLEGDDSPAFAAHVAFMTRVHATFEAEGAEAAARLFVLHWEEARDWPTMPESQRAYLTRCMPLVHGSRRDVGDDPRVANTPERLAKIRVPVTLIEGGRTDPVIFRLHEVLAGILPDARRVRVEGAGHMAPISHPGAVAQAIASGLSPLRAAS